MDRVWSAAALAALVWGVVGSAPSVVGEPAAAEPAARERPGAVVRALLRADPTAARDAAGGWYFVEPVPQTRPGPAVQAGPRRLSEAADERTFRLHSLPGSSRTLFLDFDGAEVAGTLWNGEAGLPGAFFRGWDTDGDPGTFSSAERLAVRQVWRRVAEDFAPFDVDVTTEQPPPEALDRQGPDDQVFGSWILVTDSRAATRVLCRLMCSGVAYLDVFDLDAGHALRQPGWVFPRMLFDDPKYVAETVSHEAGHQLGLLHDGTTEDTYYDGHGAWAPIMGAGFGRPIVQWSKGDYPSADNPQDDLAVIAANGMPLRPDAAGPDVAQAGPGTPRRGFIADRLDVDVHALGSCRGEVDVRVRGVRPSPDLDVGLALLDAAGTVLARADPPSYRVTNDLARGLAARITRRLPRGSYFIAVDGVGGPRRSYDDYASVGGYRWRTTGCSTPAPAG